MCLCFTTPLRTFCDMRHFLLYKPSLLFLLHVTWSLSVLVRGCQGPIFPRMAARSGKTQAAPNLLTRDDACSSLKRPSILKHAHVSQPERGPGSMLIVKAAELQPQCSQGILDTPLKDFFTVDDVEYFQHGLGDARLVSPPSHTTSCIFTTIFHELKVNRCFICL